MATIAAQSVDAAPADGDPQPGVAAPVVQAEPDPNTLPVAAAPTAVQSTTQATDPALTILQALAVGSEAAAAAKPLAHGPHKPKAVKESARDTDDPAPTVAAAKPDMPSLLRPVTGVGPAAHAFVARLQGDKDSAAQIGVDVTGVGATGSAAQASTLTVAAREAAAGAPVPTLAVPLAKVGAEIVRHAGVGETRFEIRLDPAELGRLDVRLELSDKGEAKAHITVERRETYDLLARDQKGLERTLRDAGYDARDGSISLSLRQNGSDGGGASSQRQQQPETGSNSFGSASMDADPTPIPVDFYRPRRDALVDMRI